MIRAGANSELLPGRTAWILSDGKAGHEAQCLGVVEALGLVPEIKPVQLGGIYKLMAPWGPVPLSDPVGRPGGSISPPWPTMAFATGRTTIPYIRALKRRAGLQTYTVILMDPKTGSTSADLIWVPEHDRRRGPNVITTLAAPHSFSPKRLSELRAVTPSSIAGLPKPRFGCLIGGPNSVYRYSSADEERLVRSLAALAETGAGLMVTTSRRTPQGLTARIGAALAHTPTLIWGGRGENPYPEFLAHADGFVITADSVSMVSEAAATGKPIFLLFPSGGSPKFDRFHMAMAAHGATRPLPEQGAPFETWSYEPLNSAAIIAAEIQKRWSRRAEMLPGLLNAT